MLCPPLTTGSCTGTYVLRLAKAILSGGRFTLQPGRAQAITLTFKGRQLVRLRTTKRLQAALQITRHDRSKPTQQRSTTTRILVIYR